MITADPSLHMPLLTAYAETQLKISAKTAAHLYHAEQSIRNLEERLGRCPYAHAYTTALARIETIASFGRSGGKRRSVYELLAEEHENLRKARKTPDARTIETLRPAQALALALSRAHSGSLGYDDMRAIHAELFRCTTREDFGGRLRTTNDVSGSSRYHSVESSYEPVASELIPGLLHDIAIFCADDSYPPLLQAAIAHAHVVELAPFSRGNGHFARIVIHAILRERKLAVRSVIPLSSALATSPHNYYDCLEGYCALLRPDARESRSEDLLSSGTDRHRTDAVDTYLQYFARCFTAAAQSAMRFVDESEQLIATWRERLDCRSDAASLHIVEALAGTPMFTIEEMAATIDRSFKRTSVSVAELEAAGIVENVTKGRRNRVFVARDIVELYANVKGLC